MFGLLYLHFIDFANVQVLTGSLFCCGDTASTIGGEHNGDLYLVNVTAGRSRECATGMREREWTTEITSAAPFGGRASFHAGRCPRYVHFADLLFPLGVSPLGFGFALPPPIAQAPLGLRGFCGVIKLRLIPSSLPPPHRAVPSRLPFAFYR